MLIKIENSVLHASDGIYDRVVEVEYKEGHPPVIINVLSSVKRKSTDEKVQELEDRMTILESDALSRK